MSASHLIKLAKRWGMESKCHEGEERELIMCFISDLFTEIRKVQQSDSKKHEAWLDLGKKEGFVGQSDEDVQIAVQEKFLQLTGRDLENLTTQEF